MQKRWEIELRLLLMTNRKSHKPFQMTRKSSTSDDREGSIRTPRRRSCVFRSPPWKFEFEYWIFTPPKIGLRLLKFKSGYVPGPRAKNSCSLYWNVCVFWVVLSGAIELESQSKNAAVPSRGLTSQATTLMSCPRSVAPIPHCPAFRCWLATRKLS